MRYTYSIVLHKADECVYAVPMHVSAKATIFVDLCHTAFRFYDKETTMEYATIEVKVPKAMQAYFSDGYATEYGDELRRNALLLYPYIHGNIISHGRAAEILGIKKLDLIDLYDEMGFPYFDMDISDVMQDMRNFRELEKSRT